MTIPHKLRRIRRKYRDHQGEHFAKIARDPELMVNVRYVYDLLKHNKEPTNREIRQRMGYRDRSTATKPGTVTISEHWQWWRRLPKAVRNELVRQLHASQEKQTT